VVTKIEIIAIGEELLLGTTVDTNSPYLGRKLAEFGGKVAYRTTVGDRGEEIKEALERALSRSDLIFMTGGLGPTKDDITKKTVSSLLAHPLVLHEKTLERVREHFEKRGLKMPAINSAQALLPRGSTPLVNPLGTAPGLWISVGNSKSPDPSTRDLILLPGVPAEMRAIFENLLPQLREKLNGEVLLQSTIHTCGAPESSIAERLFTVINRKESSSVAFLPKHTGVDIRIVTRGRTERGARMELEVLESKISTALDDWVWGKNEDTLEGVIGCLLTMKEIKVAVAESCTGGLIMDRLTGVPGSSHYFFGGIVAYSDEIKTKYLKVSKKTLSKYGAVSRETALAMAEGIRELAQTDLGLSVTGIAGPSGVTEEKPVGLVYFGLSGSREPLWEKHHYLGDRRMIKEQSAVGALNLLRQNLLGKV
jgi:nicotinamide-nucleotide amidase